MMLMGALSGFIVALITGNPWLGLLSAMIVGGLMGALHAFVCISLHANQVISGLALSMLGVGLSGFIGKCFVGIPLKATFGVSPIPLLNKIPILGSILFEHNVIVYISYILAIILWLILHRTKMGIMIKAVGENPAAADAAGVDVYKVRYVCTIFGGVMAGAAGAYLSLAHIPMWVENMTAGRGWIAVAIVVFATWDPLRALLGSYLFGGVEALQYWLQPWGIDPSLLGTLPYIATILVLVIIGSSKRLRRAMSAPSALCKPYIREEKVV
ncbi:MAG: ABC transporter permease [Thermoprotei archaeon]|nr:MAG: ABC transporter permease [Thermoprotei archaeon]